MRKSEKHLLYKTNLLIMLFVLFVANSLAQNGKTPSCEETDYDCLTNEYGRVLASECKGKDDDCRVDQLTKILESNPSAGAAYLNRGRFLFAKDPDRAIQDFNTAIALNPSYFQTYISLGLLYLTQKRDYEQAIIVFNKAIEAASQETRYGGHRRLMYLHNAYINRGLAYLAKRDFDKALADYNKAIELSPNDDWGYSGRGLVYAVQQDYAKAIADYSQAIKLRPNDWLNYKERGNLYLKQGEKEKGEADLNKSKELKESEDKQ